MLCYDRMSGNYLEVPREKIHGLEPLQHLEIEGVTYVVVELVTTSFGFLTGCMIEPLDHWIDNTTVVQDESGHYMTLADQKRLQAFVDGGPDGKH